MNGLVLMRYKLNPYFAILLLIGCFSCGPTSSHRQKAEELRESGDYQGAIDEFDKHIEYRLTISNRPEWENPYLYLLDEGDIFMQQNLPNKALEKYLRAKEMNVDQASVSDRLRRVGTWYEDRGDFKAAIEHLKLYRELDPLLFDPILDRIAKKIVVSEEGNKKD